jgi:hypothetical protein
MNYNVQANEKHKPFYVRRLIVQLSLFIVIAVGILSRSPLLMASAYFLSSTVLDQLFFYVFHMKSSDSVEADILLKENEATIEQLDHYSASRRKIRLVSLGFATLTGVIAYFVIPAYFLAVFCISFAASTFGLIAYLKPHIKNKYPPAFVRDDRYYVPGSGMKMGRITPGQAAVLGSPGSPPWGVIEI